MPQETRAYFEPRFGSDLSGVRIHAGGSATAAADRLGARAFTSGSDIAFGAGEYAPQTAQGRRLIAHELAHVVQGRQGSLPDAGGLYFKAKAIRFQDEPTLDEVSEGKKTLRQGDKGEAVIRIATALSELGHYFISIVDEKFDWLVKDAVTSFQDAKGLKGKVAAGEVEKTTFDALDADFSAGYKVERDVIGKHSQLDPMAGTDTLNTEERTAAARAISTEVKSAPGAPLPTFKPEIPGKGKYKDRLTDVVELAIKRQYDAMGKGKGAAHKDATKLYDWPQIELIAKAAQAAVDARFNEYYGGTSPPTLKQGVNIFDAWEDKEKTLAAGGRAKGTERANWRVQKIIEGEEVMPLDEEHGAVQSRAEEAAIIARVKAKLVRKYRTELIETDKGWPGFADPDAGKIFIQRFKGATADDRRRDMWNYFQTFIHEYIHTIESSAHRTYRKSKSEKKGGKTLREGVTDYLTKIVWNGITIDDALRKKIEGPFHDPANKLAIPRLHTYREAANAERLAGVVGIRNLLAAFFLGRVDLIGKP